MNAEALVPLQTLGGLGVIDAVRIRNAISYGKSPYSTFLDSSMPALLKTPSSRTSTAPVSKKARAGGAKQPASPQKRLDVRTSAEVRDLIERAAAVSGRSMTDLILAGAMKEAQSVIDSANVIRMSQEAQACFAKALLAPPRRNAALTRAYKHEKRLLRSDL